MNYKNSKEKQEHLMKLFEKNFSNKKLSREEKNILSIQINLKRDLGEIHILQSQVEQENKRLRQ